MASETIKAFMIGLFCGLQAALHVLRSIDAQIIDAQTALASRDDLALAALAQTRAGQPRHDLGSHQPQALNVWGRDLVHQPSRRLG